MNEQELRDGLRGAMAASSQPPPMNVDSALDHARSVHKRRRAGWAGAGASLAVVALAAGAVITLNRPGPAGNDIPVDMASQNTTETQKSQKTETSGPRAKEAGELLSYLKTALPSTLTVNDKTSESQASHQNRNGTQAWEYLVIAMVTKQSAPGTGRVFATVHTPGYADKTDVCELAKTWWGSGGACQVVDVQGKRVGLVANTSDPRTDSVAAYRYDDGTVVYVSQSRDPDNNRSDDTVPPGGMATPPMTTEQLADLAVNPTFKIG